MSPQNVKTLLRPARRGTASGFEQRSSAVRATASVVARCLELPLGSYLRRVGGLIRRIGGD
jgi:hypothetical protein